MGTCRGRGSWLALLCALVTWAAHAAVPSAAVSTARQLPVGNDVNRLAALMPAGPAMLYLPKSNSAAANGIMPRLPDGLDNPPIRFLSAPSVRAAGPALWVASADGRAATVLIATDDPLETARRGAEACGWSLAWIEEFDEAGRSVSLGEARPQNDREQARYGREVLFLAASEDEKILALATNKGPWLAVAGKMLQREILEVPNDYPTLIDAPHFRAFVKNDLAQDSIHFSAIFPDAFTPLFGTAPVKTTSEWLVTGSMRELPELGTEINAVIERIDGEIPFLRALADPAPHVASDSPLADANIMISARWKSTRALYDEWMRWMIDEEFNGDEAAARESEKELLQQLEIAPEQLAAVFGTELHAGIDITEKEWAIEIQSPAAERTGSIIERIARGSGATVDLIHLRDNPVRLIRWIPSDGKPRFYVREQRSTIQIACSELAANRLMPSFIERDVVDMFTHDSPVVIFLSPRAVGRTVDWLGISEPRRRRFLPPATIGLTPDNGRLRARITTAASFQDLQESLSPQM